MARLQRVNESSKKTSLILWRLTIGSRTWDVRAQTRSEARALLKGLVNQPLPVGLQLAKVEESR